MQVDKQPFPINVMDFNDKKVLIRLNVVDKDKGKSIIIDGLEPLMKTQNTIPGKLLLRRP
jgi:hypothetical protein